MTQWIVHPIVNQNSCEIEYENEFPWNHSTRLSDLLKKIQSKFSHQLPTQDSEIDTAIRELDYYSKQV